VAELADILERSEPSRLDALDARAALQRRIDHKYLVQPGALVSLLERLLPAFVALEIDGRRQSPYESVYFDTPGLRCYRDHVEASLPRLKVRTRLYVETRVCSLEAKLKREGGETDKASCELDPSDHGRLTAPGLRFLEAEVGDAVRDLSLTEQRGRRGSARRRLRDRVAEQVPARDRAARPRAAPRNLERWFADRDLRTRSAVLA
jgi:hypothetical protein